MAATIKQQKANPNMYTVSNPTPEMISLAKSCAPTIAKYFAEQNKIACTKFIADKINIMNIAVIEAETIIPELHSEKEEEEYFDTVFPQAGQYFETNGGRRWWNRVIAGLTIAEAKKTMGLR